MHARHFSLCCEEEFTRLEVVQQLFNVAQKGQIRAIIEYLLVHRCLLLNLRLVGPLRLKKDKLDYVQFDLFV